MSQNSPSETPADQKPEHRILKPSEFLKGRRPEEYSDSFENLEIQPSKSLLEYHLETLTNRGQENEFERFARMMAEHLICPNLLPQTGPTGGGDSKVDSETYPVADDIAMRWYQGSDSSEQRWAFAFSAKKDWKPKVKSDIAKLVGTGRGYKVAYFITNQFVRDKARSEIEDELRKLHDIDVRILDRTWIIERVSSNDLWRDTADILEIDGLTTLSSKVIGPNDQRRIEELEKLDKQIADPKRYLGVSFQLVEDCLRSANLASDLERDRHQVDGRFQVALKMANQGGSSRQIIRVLYAEARAACFKYDDFHRLLEKYEELEGICLKSIEADDLSKLNTLLHLVSAGVAFGTLDWEKSGWVEKGDRLEEALLRVAADENRLNNSLEAQVLLHFLRLTRGMQQRVDVSELNSHVDELIKVFDEIEGLGSFPFEQYRRLIFDVEEIIERCPKFDELYELVLEIYGKRTSESTVGEQLTHKGWDKLTAEKYNDAIRFCGRGKARLVKEECHETLVENLVVAGAAYKSIGLHWAAKSSLLSAVSLSVRHGDSHGGLHRLTHLALRPLISIDLAEGKISEVMWYLRLVHLAFEGRDDREEKTKRFVEFFQLVDLSLAILILDSPLVELKALERLPDILERDALEVSRQALLFALGHTDRVDEQTLRDLFGSEQEPEEFFTKLYYQPARDQLPRKPQLYLGGSTQLTSRILGAKISLLFESSPMMHLVAGSLLASLESFFATSIATGVVPYRETFSLSLETATELEEGEYFQFGESPGEADTLILVGQKFDGGSSSKIETLRTFSLDLIAKVLSEVFVTNDPDSFFEKMLEKEEVIERSSVFCEMINPHQVIFGDSFCCPPEKIFDLSKVERFPLQRKQQWQPEEPAEEDAPKKEELEELGSVPDAEGWKDRYNHSDARVLSVIDVPAWNRSTWRGVMFGWTNNIVDLPFLGLIFENEEAAREIFEGWSKRFGVHDTDDQIRISLIREIDKANPQFYRATVSSNLETCGKFGDGSTVTMPSRIQVMEPATDDNLRNFLKRCSSGNEYWLVPTILSSDGKGCSILPDLRLRKQNLIVKSAWEIGANNFDMMGLSPDDDPIIPKGKETTAPVVDALKLLRSFQNS